MYVILHGSVSVHLRQAIHVEKETVEKVAAAGGGSSGGGVTTTTPAAAAA